MKKKAVKLLSILLAAALLIGASVGGTLAWLSAKTETVTNTFTVGNIAIELSETDADKMFKMVPGGTIEKDPKVTVVANSEDCYLFVKIEKSANLDDFIVYKDNVGNIADGWLPLSGNDDVYYRAVTETNVDQTFSVLKGDKVAVKNTVTKMMMDALTDATRPTLSFTAYAVQSANLEGNTDAEKVAFAWTQANTASNYPTTP